MLEKFQNAYKVSEDFCLLQDVEVTYQSKQMMLFNDFPHKLSLKNKATSNLNLYKVLKKIGLDTKVRIYLGDGPLSTDNGSVNLHPSKGTHWVCYINENYFDSYECVCPKNLSKFIIKRNGYFL